MPFDTGNPPIVRRIIIVAIACLGVAIVGVVALGIALYKG